MRRLAVPTSAVCVALIAAACGGSNRPAATRTLPTLAPTVTLRTRTVPSPPTRAQIERAARLTATRPGFVARVSARIRLRQLGGGAVSAIGSGFFDPRTGSGTLDVAVSLPGILALVGPLPTQIRLVGGEAYVQVPSDLAGQLGTSDGWLEDSVSALGLGPALSPPDILREVARDATGHIAGQRARVTLDSHTGLVRTITLSYAVAGGYHVHVHLRLTGFAPQRATRAPDPARTGGLQPALRTLGF